MATYIRPFWKPWGLIEIKKPTKKYISFKDAAREYALKWQKK